MVAASFDGATADDIDAAAKALLEFELQSTHLEQTRLGFRQELDQKIHVTTRAAGTPCHGAEEIHPGQSPRTTHFADNLTDFLDRWRD